MRIPFWIAATAPALSAAFMAGAALAQPVGEAAPTATASAIKTVFVIAFENHDSTEIYGDTKDAPYINGTLLPAYAHSTNFNDELPALESEPHYVWMEAGTNAFSDHTFTTDDDPSSSNSTKNTAHLVTQIKNATTGVSWMSYQEGITKQTGACPVASSAFYAAKHDPFVFFRDVSGKTPSKTNAYCGSHHKDYSALAADLANHAVATFNFITPNLCHDMHGASGCPNSNLVQSGDQWLQANLPALISYANANQGAIFLTWDEGDSTHLMPFIAIGPHVKTGYTSTVNYNHSSLLKSIERILVLPTLPKVSSSNDFTDLFTAGFFP